MKLNQTPRSSVQILEEEHIDTLAYYLRSYTMYSSLPLLSITELTRVLSSFQTARLTTRTPICGSHAPRKCSCSVRLRERNNILSNKSLAQSGKAYLAVIRNRTTSSVNNTVADVLTYLQENYGQLMPHKLLEREDIFKKTIYNPCKPIANVFSSVKELLDFNDSTRT